MAPELFLNHTGMTTRLWRLEISSSLKAVITVKEMLKSFIATEAEQNLL